MNLTIRIIRKLLALKNKLLSRYYKIRSYLEIRIDGGSLNWSKSATASVPIRAEGAGNISISDGVQLGFNKAVRIGNGEILLQVREPNSHIIIGKGTITSNNISIVAMHSITIGDNCQIGDMVSIYDCDFHEIDPATRNHTSGKISPVVVGNNVWFGSRVMILKGVTIGDNTVIAAGSIVTKSIPANVIAGGIPAGVIRNISEN